MSSYNNIRKIKYTKNPSDIVSLHEYIMFEDARGKEKFVVFKFANNVNQRLLGFSFEVLQYNKDNELIEKSVVLHENFVAEANDLFVPNAKLKVNFECESLEVRLETASFDRVAWKDGEFTDNSYRFDSYAATVLKPAQPVAATEAPEEKGKKPVRQTRLNFGIKNIYRRNRAVFPSVFNVLMAVVVIALTLASAIYFRFSTGYKAVGDFLVKETSPGYVTIMGYTGKSDNVEITTELEGFSIAAIGKGAFKNSNVKTVQFSNDGDIRIASGAFSDCSKLTSVTSTATGSVFVLAGAFTNCTALDSFIVPTAFLFEKCFNGTNNISSLGFMDSDAARLLDIFNGLNTISLSYLNVKTDKPDEFYEQVF